MSDRAEIGVYHVDPVGGRHGSVVLVQEIFGVTDHIRRMAGDYEAGPGFNSDRRADYHEPSADLAKVRTLELFRATGG